MNYVRIPSPAQIQETPEFAALAVLNAALLGAIHTLAAAHPGMCDGDDPIHPYEAGSPNAEVARRIITGAVSLRAKLARYKTEPAGPYGQLFMWEERPYCDPRPFQ